MKVKEFIKLLQEKYPEDAELYFATSVYDCEVAFDEVKVCDYDEDFEETDVFLTLSEQNAKDFTLSVFEEKRNKFVDDLNSLIDKYFY